MSRRSCFLFRQYIKTTTDVFSRSSLPHAGSQALLPSFSWPARFSTCCSCSYLCCGRWGYCLPWMLCFCGAWSRRWCLASEARLCPATSGTWPNKRKCESASSMCIAALLIDMKPFLFVCLCLHGRMAAMFFFFSCPSTV